MACPTLSARKKIQANTVSAKVILIDKNSFTVGKFFPLATISRLFLLVLKIIEGIMYRAFKSPHTTKVQLAPCQNPLTRKIINVFRIFIHVPPLLPPSGMYKQSLNQEESEICQRLQNSAMSREKQGNAKFLKRSIPKRRAVPNATSE